MPPSATQDPEYAKAKSSLSKDELTKAESMLAKQLDKLVASLNPEDCNKTLLTLQTCFKNIALYPHDDTYRQIKLSNKAFCSKVWRHPDCEVFMKMSGWVVEGDHVKLRDDSHVQIACAIISQRLQVRHDW